MIIEIRWKGIRSEKDSLWSVKCGLYAYFVRRTLELLYIGKADGKTVRQRYASRDKKKLWRDFEKQRGPFPDLYVFVGCFYLPVGSCLTSEMIADIESLLIYKIKPWGNIMSRNSRIPRPGLLVRCKGEWRFKEREFYDEG